MACTRSEPQSFVNGLKIGEVYSFEQVPEPDKSEIKNEISKYTAEDILMIIPEKDGSLQVMTGVVRGPLDGGGNIYILKKVKGAWKVYDDGAIRGWVS